jgi:hypothetical protein
MGRRRESCIEIGLNNMKPRTTFQLQGLLADHENFINTVKLGPTANKLVKLKHEQRRRSRRHSQMPPRRRNRRVIITLSERIAYLEDLLCRIVP